MESWNSQVWKDEKLPRLVGWKLSSLGKWKMTNMEVTKHGQMGTNKMVKMEITKHVERIPHLATRLNVGSQVENKWMGHKILKDISQNVIENILWKIHLLFNLRLCQLNCPNKEMWQCA